MNKVIINFLAIAFYFLALPIPVISVSNPPLRDKALPDIRFPAPDNLADRTYLGLSRGEYFKIQEVETYVVIIEIFSMYCPYCQREAPEVNKLYHKIESNPGLKGKIKLLGIGAGNSSFEVEVFKKKYHVPFPLIPDNDFTIHKSLGDVRTPYFIGVKIKPEGTNQVLYSKLGAMKGVDQFLNLILKRSGLRKEGKK